jgi:PKD repeat protein
MNQMRRFILLALVMIVSTATSVVSQQVYRYDFQNSLNESSGSGPALNALGVAAYTNESLPVSCLSRPVYSFIQNDGLQFDNGAAGSFLGTEYSIEMYFRFTNNTGFFRIIDFKNRTSDFGLYATATQVQFYDELTVNNTAFASNSYVHLVLTRNSTSEEVNIYINGSLIGSFIDDQDKALPNVDNVFNFFRDDLVFGNEAQPGRIALLKLYDYELAAGDVSDNFDNLEQTSAAVAFSASPTSACLVGNLFNFTNESQNSGGVTYNWEFGDGNTATGTNASHSYSADGNYTVLLIADNGSGCTDTASFEVTVGGQAVIAASGPTDLCNGGSVTLSASPGSGYQWSTGATTQDILVTTAGTYTVTVDYGNGCISTANSVTVNVSTGNPGAINYMIGSSIACAGQSLPYTINTSNRALYYIWTLPANATISGQSPYQTSDTTVTIDYGVGFSGGVVEVRAYNGCGVRGPRSKTITSSAPLTPAPIVGTGYACAGNTYTYSTALRSGVDSYNWTAPAGAIITGQGSNQVDITFPGGFTSGYVRVTASNPCGTSNQRSLFVRSKPAQPGTITGPTSGLCGSVQTYSISPVNGATSYTWTAPTGSTVLSGQGTTSVQIQFNNGLNTGFVRVTADNPCGSSGVRRLAVSGGVVVADDPDSLTACTGDQASFTVGAAFGTGFIYQWRKDGSNLVDGGAVSGSNAATLVINPVDATWAGNYDCIVRRSCGSADTSAIALMQVDVGGPQPGPISGPGVACEGDQWDYTIAPVPGATSYNWSGDLGLT